MSGGFLPSMCLGSFTRWTQCRRDTIYRWRKYLIDIETNKILPHLSNGDHKKKVPILSTSQLNIQFRGPVATTVLYHFWAHSIIFLYPSFWNKNQIIQRTSWSTLTYSHQTRSPPASNLHLNCIRCIHCIHCILRSAPLPLEPPEFPATPWRHDRGMIRRFPNDFKV